jgi:hypothetical protein
VKGRFEASTTVASLRWSGSPEKKVSGSDQRLEARRCISSLFRKVWEALNSTLVITASYPCGYINISNDGLNRLLLQDRVYSEQRLMKAVCGHLPPDLQKVIR